MNTGESSICRRWFCLRTQPRREYMAALNLRGRVGIEVFAPRIPTNRHSQRRALEALFPGYLFARFDYSAELRRVISTGGVTGVVNFGGHSPPVADGVIEFLRAQIGLAGSMPAPVLTEGAWVRLTAGCFRDLEGRVLTADSGTERVRILLRLLGRDLQVSVFARQLRLTGGRFGHFPEGLLASQTAGHHTPVERSMEQ